MNHLVDEKCIYEFDRIYNTDYWGGSGGGSKVSSTEIYRKFLKDFIIKNKIKSVSDIGCGDWEFSQYINWDDLTYKGYDIVESVIQSNNKKFAKPNIEFKLLKDYNKISHSDLLICKDVLQHLNHKEVNKFIEIVFPKFKKILLTNDVSNISLNDDSRYNKDLKPGEYAWFDIRKGPYLLKAKTLLTYNVHYGKDGNYWKKETVLVNLNN